ncbi:hypothetical protein CDAR_307921 [Caerostris darwini]|uniref:Uncharacterized protein n=1 Tax=Caerostris darwini TaxID=1538125 RepID=A0AAV4P7M6_9ARAC|nr:hypothetical protein CDAR_307921 [Caerostris darwini]
MCRPFRLLFCDQPIRLLPPDLQPPEISPMSSLRGLLPPSAKDASQLWQEGRRFNCITVRSVDIKRRPTKGNTPSCTSQHASSVTNIYGPCLPRALSLPAAAIINHGRKGP